MSLLYSDKKIRDKWLNEYLEEIKSNKERKEFEKNKKVNEEKLNLEKINEELQNEKLEKKLKREQIKRENQSELDKYFIKKKEEEKRDLIEKLTNTDKLTLPLKHEERLEKYIQYMSRLTDKIDKNMGIYKNYHNRNHSVNLVQDAKGSNFKDELKLENHYNREFNATERTKFKDINSYNNKLGINLQGDKLNNHLMAKDKNDPNKIYYDAPNDYKDFENQGCNYTNNSNKIVKTNKNENQNDPLGQMNLLDDANRNINQINSYGSNNVNQNNRKEFYNENAAQNQNNNYQLVKQDRSNFIRASGNEANISSPMQQKYFQMMNQKDNYRVNKIDNIGVNPSIFNYDKFNKKVFDQYQNYESYNFHKQTKPIEKDFTINKNSLENVYNKDASDYKALLKNNLNFNKEEMTKHNRNKLLQYEQIKPNVEERLKNLEQYRHQEYQNNYIKKQQQRMYHDFLDGQIKYRNSNSKEPSPSNSIDKQENNYLLSHNYINSSSGTNKQKINPNNNNILENSSSDPYNPSNRFNIGDTKLSHNPIVCAVPDYKYNKYIYKDLFEIPSKGSLSRSLIVNGNNIVN